MRRYLAATREPPLGTARGSLATPREALALRPRLVLDPSTRPRRRAARAGEGSHAAPSAARPA
jgi:hypothetical protein